MTFGCTLAGLDTVLNRLQKEIDKQGTVFRKNLIAAGLTLEAACTEKITKVLYSIPEAEDKERKRTGNLRASRFTIWTNHVGAQAPSFDVVEGEEPVLPGFNQALEEARAEVERASAGKNKTAVVVGYGAYYAVYVHEGVDGKFNGFKWMELALQEQESKLVDILCGRGGATT